MNGRRLFRQYAQEKFGKEAIEFVRIEPDFYSFDKLVTKNSRGEEEECTIHYKEMVHWMIQKFPNLKDA